MLLFSKAAFHFMYCPIREVKLLTCLGQDLHSWKLISKGESPAWIWHPWKQGFCNMCCLAWSIATYLQPIATDWDTGRLIDWDIERLRDWEAERLRDIERLRYWEIARLRDWTADRLKDWETKIQRDWWTERLSDWETERDWMTEGLRDWETR